MPENQAASTACLVKLSDGAGQIGTASGMSGVDNGEFVGVRFRNGANAEEPEEGEGKRKRKKKLRMKKSSWPNWNRHEMGENKGGWGGREIQVNG